MLAANLPHGGTLLDARWNSRHRLIRWALWAHIGALWAFAAVADYSPHDPALIGSVVPIMIAAWLSGWERLGRTAQSAVASLALLCCAATLVGLWGGATEAHFDFFVVITLLMLYGDWVPFAIALVFVLAHHAVLGLAAPYLVFDHSGNAVELALVHAGFALTLAAANLAVWHGTDTVQRDPDTGLLSHDLMLERLRRSIERRRKTGRQRGIAVLIVCDIDRLRLVNEGLGRHAGDHMIREIARRLRRSAPGGALIGRQGGDQFLLLFEGLADARQAEHACDRLVEAVAEPLDMHDWQVVPAASFGVVDLDRSQDAETAFADAVAASERAKSLGGGRWCWFEQSISTDRARRHDVERALRRALDSRRVLVYFQPVVDLDANSLVGFEALARIEAEDGSVISPDQFIPLAEATGLVHKLGSCVIDAALGQVADWAQRYPAVPLWIGINCSPIELADESYAARLHDLLLLHRIAPAHVSLEITESAVLADDEATRDRLARIDELGVRLSLDDFGAGYSNLRYLTSLPFRKLKIDRKLVGGIDRNLGQRAIVKAVVEMSDALGLIAVAEGVETTAEAEVLRAMRCPLVQGYLYGRPLTAEAATTLVAKQTPRSDATRPWAA